MSSALKCADLLRSTRETVNIPSCSIFKCTAPEKIISEVRDATLNNREYTRSQIV